MHRSPSKDRDKATEANGADLLSSFDFDPRTRVIFGPGTIDRLGEVAKELGGKRVLLVTDKGVKDAGHGQKGADLLRAAGLHVAIFDEVNQNPTTDDVDRALALAKSESIDFLVGLGGGSSMDCAKGVNFLLTNGGKIEDYVGSGKATKPMLPMVAVPTTAGTGSEAQSFALIAHAKTHMKMACGDKKAACRAAILDPSLTLSMPRSVTAATGIDALSHALETYVSQPRNVISQLFSRRSWRLLVAGFARVLADPNDVQARGAMLVGSHLAGAAIENSMLGAAHALANPLSAHYNTTHGYAVGVMLPHVVRFNAPVVAPLYARLAADINLCDEQDPNAPEMLAERIELLLALAGAPATLTDCGVEKEMIPQMAEEASAQWTGRFNPRPVDAASLQELYECAFSPAE